MTQVSDFADNRGDVKNSLWERAKLPFEAVKIHLCCSECALFFAKRENRVRRLQTISKAAARMTLRESLLAFAYRRHCSNWNNGIVLAALCTRVPGIAGRKIA